MVALQKNIFSTFNSFNLKHNINMLAIFLIAALIPYIIRLLLIENEIKFQYKFFKWILAVHFILLVFLICAFVMSHYNLYFRGYRSHSIIYLLFCLSGIMVYWCFPKSNWVIISVIFVFFESTTSTALVIEMIYDASYQVYYHSSKYRIESTFSGIMAPAKLPDLIKTNFIFEKKYTLNGNYIAKSNLDSLKIIDLSNDTVVVVFYHKDVAKYDIQNPFMIKVKVD